LDVVDAGWFGRRRPIWTIPMQNKFGIIRVKLCLSLSDPRQIPLPIKTAAIDPREEFHRG
jgi:hypothetical protein